MAKQAASLGLVQSIIGSGLYPVDNQKKAKPIPGKPLVTVSRYYGTPDAETATLLAERLGVPMYDRRLLDAITKEAKGDKHLLERLDEHVTSLVDDMVHAFFSKKSTNKDVYFRYMAKVIVGIGPGGGVIVGRAAHQLLPERAAFRVRLDGSLRTCTRRLMDNQQMKKADAEKEILRVNKDRDKFTEEVTRRFPTPSTGYDLVLNSDIFTPEQMVRIIVLAMQEAGFQIPAEGERPVEQAPVVES
ncbi:MAG: cytidylate kinase-like family protein [Magnetococcales bacterium]|nr:cytidylate kinase-like family protein [Magnetococcales bacterium]MBF0115757.1 cytidylate kinase-like family protein [Magnetococcales bacterium]